MDDKDLDKMLSDMDVPPYDKNAKKIALNLAIATFKDVQREKIKKSEKKSQGLFSCFRLTNSSTKENRRDPMAFSKKKLVYGGLATACVALFVGTVLVEFPISKVIDKNNFGLRTGDTSARSTDFAHIEESETATNKLFSHKSYEGKSEEMPYQPAPLNEYHKDSKTVQTEKIAPASRERLKKRNETMGFARGFTDGLADISGAATQHAAPVIAMEQKGLDSEIFDPGYYQDVGRDKFEDFKINPVKLVTEEPVSTFSVDVDTASYSFVRGQLNRGVLPQKDAVRIEELVNYFDYDYPLPKDKAAPFKASVAVTASPWASGKELVHIGIKGYDIPKAEQPRSNLVFLLDVSGSMNNPNKLPLLKQSLKMLLDQLGEQDTVGIVVYAGAAGTVLEPTKASEKHKIIAALDNLRAGGSTAGAEGIRQAYNLAEANFDKEAVNRVILATDGDFNVGITNREELKDFVERKRQTGIFLSVFGFGMGNYNDHMMQTLAQNGNGVAAYIDNLNEARKVLVEEATSTLFPIAKDVKIQVEFNPETIAEYRLIGYETRHLNREDFNNDKVDAGDIGAGHTVTAIYEVTPKGSNARLIDEPRYGHAEKVQKTKADTNFKDEYAFLKIRYKLPEEDTSKLITTPILKSTTQDKHVMNEIGFGTAVTGFAQILKGGEYTGDFDYDDVIKMAQATKGDDEFGYRTEFIQLVRQAKSAAAIQNTNDKPKRHSNTLTPMPDIQR